MRHGIDFFRDEIRNGFYIPTAVKQSWAASLDVLAEIDRICRKHDIKYFADWGSFLGAVRHGGFVPWDDDLDICMLRDDYVKFRAVCDDELPENYCIHDYERQKDHWLFLSRVVNNHHISFDENYLGEHYNFPWLSGVDIFIKDYLYRDSDKEKKRCEETMRILAEAEVYIGKLSSGKCTGAEAVTARQKAIALYKKAEERMAEVTPEDSDKVCQLFPWGLKGVPGESKEFYQETIYLPFEDTLIPVPAQYNRVLTGRYGDYNVVKKGVSGHDYPTFESQRKAFEKETGTALPRFSFDKRMLEKTSQDAGIESEQLCNRKVLFLPIGPREWKSLEATFVKECSDPDTDVYVVPLPLMHRDIYGQIMATDEEILEAEHFEDYVDIINGLEAAGVSTDRVCLMGFTDYDLQEHFPDRIYIQSPYDAQNAVLTIPPYYYSDNLRLFTKELVYIPIGPVGEFTDQDMPDILAMNFYVTMPGAVYADKIIVQSENIRKHYVDKLLEFCKGTDRKYWEEKITAETLFTSLEKDDRSQVRRVLYGISLYEYYEHKEKFETSLKSRLDIFSENKEKVQAVICLYPGTIEDDALQMVADNDSSLNEFCAIITRLSADSGVEVIKKPVTGNVEKANFVGRFDAYYGSSLPIIHEFLAQKKPVMIANYEL